MNLFLKSLARIDPNIFLLILTSRLISVIISYDNPESSVVAMVAVLLNPFLRNRFWPEAMSCVVPPPVPHCCVSKVRAQGQLLSPWVSGYFSVSFMPGKRY